MPVKLQPGEELVLEATFDPAWKSYSLATSMIAMGSLACFLIFPVLLPSVAKSGKLAIVPLLIVVSPFAVWYQAAKWWAARYFTTLECYLTSRSLIYRRGIFWKIEKTIPLSRIQDLGMMQGPLMRRFGIHRLKIETAGQSTPGGAGEAALMGVVDAPEFRDRVLGLRDSLDMNASDPRDGLGQLKTKPVTPGGLAEIHETLKQIEGHLARMADSSADQ